MGVEVDEQFPSLQVTVTLNLLPQGGEGILQLLTVLLVQFSWVPLLSTMVAV